VKKKKKENNKKKQFKFFFIINHLRVLLIRFRRDFFSYEKKNIFGSQKGKRRGHKKTQSLLILAVFLVGN